MADVPAGSTEDRFGKWPEFPIAERQELVAIKLAVLWVESRVSRTSANGKQIQRIDRLFWVSKRPPLSIKNAKRRPYLDGQRTSPHTAQAALSTHRFRPLWPRTGPGNYLADGHFKKFSSATHSATAERATGLSWTSMSLN